MDAFPTLRSPTYRGPRGQIQLVTGPMFSGKTTELLRRIRILGIARKRVMLIRYRRDTRYSDELVATHDRSTNCGSNCKTFSVNKLSEIPASLLDDFDVVGIDEGQFFSELLEFAEETANRGKTVIVSALDGDFLRNPFGDVCKLVPRVELFTKKSAMCQGENCHNTPAAFSTRRSAETSVEVIGGADKYIPTCRRCYNRYAALNEAAAAAAAEAAEAPTNSDKETPKASSTPQKPKKENKSASPVSVADLEFSMARQDGSLELVIGPMFSGKTTEMLQRIRLAHIGRQRVLLIKYCKDKRYSDDGVATHDKVTGGAIKTLSVAKLASVGDAYKDYDVIGVDEGQFYPDLAAFVDRAANDGKRVVVAALDGDFMRNPFGQVCQLIPRAEKVNKLASVCLCCHTHAAFSKRISAETDVEVIGGADKYVPTCRECYNNVHASPLTVDMDVTAEKPNFAATDAIEAPRAIEVQH